MSRTSIKILNMLLFLQTLHDIGLRRFLLAGLVLAKINALDALPG